MANLFTEVANEAFEKNPMVQKWTKEIFNITSIEDGIDKIFTRSYSYAQDCISTKVISCLLRRSSYR